MIIDDNVPQKLTKQLFHAKHMYPSNQVPIIHWRREGLLMAKYYEFNSSCSAVRFDPHTSGTLSSQWRLDYVDDSPVFSYLRINRLQRCMRPAPASCWNVMASLVARVQRCPNNTLFDNWWWMELCYKKVGEQKATKHLTWCFASI